MVMSDLSDVMLSDPTVMECARMASVEDAFPAFAGAPILDPDELRSRQVGEGDAGRREREGRCSDRRAGRVTGWSGATARP
jgi:hypothetical protein